MCCSSLSWETRCLKNDFKRPLENGIAEVNKYQTQWLQRHRSLQSGNSTIWNSASPMDRRLLKSPMSVPRPQTPAVTPSRELGNTASTPAMPAPSTASNTSPHLRTQGDAFMGGGGGSRSNTRPPTPFNPSYSVPATPPDLYLVTRNSPPISQSLWENFQPDKLFPEGTGANMNLPMFSPGQSAIDPQLAQQSLANMPSHPQQMPLQPQLQQQTRGPRAPGSGSPMQNMQPGMGMNYAWPNQFDTMGMTTGPDIGSPDDSWSNSSKGQAPVPTTLNVEDWYVAHSSSRPKLKY